ncbi:hypothetical protein U1Q18_014747 [Sarracenia purpurea var. burkii]
MAEDKPITDTIGDASKEPKSEMKKKKEKQRFEHKQDQAAESGNCLNGFIVGDGMVKKKKKKKNRDVDVEQDLPAASEGKKKKKSKTEDW